MTKVSTFGKPEKGTPKNFHEAALCLKSPERSEALSPLVSNVSRKSAPPDSIRGGATHEYSIEAIPGGVLNPASALPDKTNIGNVRDISRYITNKAGQRKKKKKEKKEKSPIERLHTRKKLQQPNMLNMCRLYENEDDERRALRYLRGAMCHNTFLLQESTLSKISFSCGLRQCKMCSAARAYKQALKYIPILERMGSLVFVTLTAKTCKGSELKDQLRLRKLILSQIIEFYKKRNQRNPNAWRLIGLLKNEITIRPDDFYHPHFHLVLAGTHGDGNLLILEWMKRCRKKGIDSGWLSQKVIEVSTPDKAITELTKYVCKDANGKEEKITSHPVERQRVVWEALEGTRTLHPIALKGIEAKVEEDENLGLSKGVPVHEDTPLGVWRWQNKEKDWLNNAGQNLMRFQRSEKITDG